MSYYDFEENKESKVEPTTEPVVEPTPEPTPEPVEEPKVEQAVNSTANSYYNNDKQNKKAPKKSKAWIIIGCIVLALAVVSVFGSIISSALNNFDGDSKIQDILDDIDNNDDTEYEEIGQTETDTNIGTSSTDSSFVMMDASATVENVMPSVVAITSTTVQEMYNTGGYYDDFFDFYFGGFGGFEDGFSETYDEIAAGSGIILDQNDTELLIVTNNHVVEGADELSIRFYGQSDEEGVDGYVKGTSPENDVAVVAVKLEDIPSDVLSSIKKATIGDSDAVKVGEGVIAIGNALGYGQSVTAGIISAKDRIVVLEDQEMTLLQTDAAINGGNSGGALINSKGEVIGINVAKYSASAYDTTSIEGMGFAIPISSVKDVIEELENMKTRQEIAEEKRGYLGIVAGYDVTEEISENYHMPVGVLVEKVVKNSPADKAGIVAEDIITKFDGQTIETFTELKEVMQYYAAGEKVTVTIAYRDGRDYTETDVEVTLGDSSAIEEVE